MHTAKRWRAPILIWKRRNSPNSYPGRADVDARPELKDIMNGYWIIGHFEFSLIDAKSTFGGLSASGTSSYHVPDGPPFLLGQPTGHRGESKVYLLITIPWVPD